MKCTGQRECKCRGSCWDEANSFLQFHFASEGFQPHDDWHLDDTSCTEWHMLT